ncbi:CoA-substrate-specific enzyme activase [Thioalkalivibrio nitratireducens DSM 14787]|uniref:CoA-substrate-specific enzyme activase n=2 Tax=Thioalkalivibrio nitratireducens TaxID=186931 RepID=L0DUL7_THIND|nr:CoA-substrate-specific enzyme activase [Thioalkalivibrio nitratireducens DSM 14787]
MSCCGAEACDHDSRPAEGDTLPVRFIARPGAERPVPPNEPFRPTEAYPEGLMIGLDVGSTTVKALVVDPARDATLWQDYRRHQTRQAETVLDFLQAIEAAFPDTPRTALRLFATGSGAGALVDLIGAKFVQEVNAVSLAVEALYPEVQSVVELGGQDAKIIIYKDLGQRGKKKIPSMNDKCAGGTGAVIDKIRAKLDIPPEVLPGMPYRGQTLHPVAGKCGVFAETDINSLQKQGVPAGDLMASLYESIIQQNLSVLARGHTLRPSVLLLGGPNTFLTGLQECWRHNLKALWQERNVALPDPEGDPDDYIITPENAEYFAALGATLFGRQEVADDADIGRYHGTDLLCWQLEHGRRAARGEGGRRGGLAAGTEELDAFLHEFRPEPWQPATFRPGQMVEAFLGIDGGSTSTKGVLMDTDGQVLAKAYRLSQGNPIADTVEIIDRLHRQVADAGAALKILGTGTTGYAKDILQGVLKADTALVETVAHTQACLHHYADTDVVVDVGGQDIKLIFLKDGRVRDFKLNTQCSAGNGYFLQATGGGFGFPVEEYADIAFSADAMPEFGYGCAVFMQSDIVDFQRRGWQANEIMAGLAAVLPKNIWHYVAQIPNPALLGRKFVLQGGTQRNLAAVKAQVDFLRERFRKQGAECEIHVHRHCGESGAIGAALEARRLWREGRSTEFIGLERSREIDYTARRDESTRCNFCKNQCLRTFIDVVTGRGRERLIVATCEKGEVEDVEHMRRIKAAMDAAKERAPNFVEIAARQMFRQVKVDDVADPLPCPSLLHPLRRRQLARRAAMERREVVRIGIPRVLNLYSHAPFFIGYFTSLGVPFRNLVFSDYTDAELYKQGAKRGAIDPCYPSKLGIAHVHNLLVRKHRRNRPLTHIFFPMVQSFPSHLHGIQASSACPTAVATAEATHAAFVKEGDLFRERGIRFKKTLLNLDEPALCARQMVWDWGEELGITEEESRRAVDQGLGAMEDQYVDLRRRQRETLDQLERDGGIGVVVLARPYHNDPGVHHEIVDELQRHGYPVLWQDALPTDPDILERLFGAEVRAGEIASPLEIADVWKNSYSENSSRKLWAAKYVARHPSLVAVELSSFKCGHDAPVYTAVEEIVERSGTPYFCFKDIDENRPSGSIKIRTETIAYFLTRYSDPRR